MNNTKTKQYHMRLAKSVAGLYHFQTQIQLSKKDSMKLNKYILSIKSECDNLISETNPEIKDNITWYYGKFSK